MKKLFYKLIPVIIVLLALILMYPSLRRKAREHVNYITATNDHPLNCISCHAYKTKNRLISKIVNADYFSPFNLAVSSDGKRLFVVAEEGDALLVIDTERSKVAGRIQVGDKPHSVILDNDENLAYVSNQWSDEVSVIDLKELSVINTLKTGNGPAGLALSSDGKILYVVNSYSSDISVIDLAKGVELKRLAAGNNPTGIRMSPDKSSLYVTSRRSHLVHYGETISCEISVLDDKNSRIADRKDVTSAYLMENVAFTPEGDLAFIPLIRPKNYVPSIQVEKGFMMTCGFGIIEQKENGRIIQLLLDEPNRYFADPFGIAITPDGKKAFITSSGVDVVSVIDIDSVRALISSCSSDMLDYYSNHLGISGRYVIKRISTGANPKGVVMSPDGKLLYVAERLEDRIAVINTETLETAGNIYLGGPRRITVNRRGKRLLNNAGHTFQTQYSCYTCHPDEHEDGLIYNMASKDMGRNVTNTQSLRDIAETAPFKWNGKNQTVYKQDGMRFSTVLTRTEPFSYKDLDAIVAYIMTGIPYPPNNPYNPDGELNEVQLRGKAIFERTHDTKGREIPEANRCITCHPAPYYTNLKSVNVGTLLASDDSMMLDTPHLNNIYASPPYLHHGLAMSLEEIWTKFSPLDQHGVANDLTKIQLNELIEYLKSLRGPQFYSEDLANAKAEISNH